MKLALTGLANSGRTTLFNALTGLNIETTVYTTTIADPHIGVVKVPDDRVDELSKIYNPKKTTYATVEYIDYLGLTKGDTAQNRKVFDHIKDADALVHVIRAFADDAVVHPLEGVDPVRDYKAVETELIFSDLELIEKRFERMESGRKTGKKPDESEKKVLQKCRENLEREIPLRHIEFGDEELKAIRHLQFISILPMINVSNVSEDDLGSDKAQEWLDQINASVSNYPVRDKTATVLLSGKIEMEISQLSADEADEFLNDLGISEPAKNRLIYESYKLLGLVSFLTVGDDEVRAWTISKGTDAQKAAGKIHSDIERGFIRAEVVSYDDFMAAGSMAEVKQKGQARLEGKTYVVRDGDIINFRFNV
jgi:GTP-binding protein YchF